MGGKLPALADSRPLRLLFFFLFYGAQGVAVGFFTFAMPAWFAANGASLAQTGAVVSAAMFPWGIKFINGFIIDRFTFLPMGRRRAWIVGAQVGLLLGFGLLALINPGIEDVVLLASIGFAINLIVNFQDVAVDGLAADIVPAADRGRTIGVMFGGQSVMIAATATLTGWLLQSYGLRGAALMCIAYVVVVLLFACCCRERQGERLLPWSAGATSPINADLHIAAWRPLIIGTWHAMARRVCILLWVAPFIWGITYGMSLSVLPALGTQQAGFSAGAYSALTGSINLGVGVASLVLLGVMADWIGPLRMFRAGLLIGTLACGLMLLAQPWWHTPVPVVAMSLTFLTLRLVLNVPYNAMALGLVTPAVAATQMTIFNSAANLGISLAGFMLAPLDHAGGKPLILAAMGVFAFIALVLTLAIKPGELRPVARD